MARACVARVGRLMTKKQVCLRTTGCHAATSEGELRMARTRPQRPGRRIARRLWLFNCCRAGGGCVCKPGWLWPLRMAERCEWAGDGRGRKAEHGGVGPHSRGASGMAFASGAGEVGSFSWRSRARRLVGSVTRRRGGSSAHRPSGRDPGTGVMSQRTIGPPSRAGGLMPRRG